MADQERINSYWFEFERTGAPEVDEVLQSVASAGRAYHSTECWADKEGDAPSHVDYIQEAANKVAQELQSLRRERDEMEKALELIQDIGFDYDGMEKPESLKRLIDELVGIAGKARKALSSPKAAERQTPPERT